MKLNYTLTCILLLSISVLFSQQTPIDFSDVADNFTGFSGSSFLFNSDPEDAGNAVGQFSNSGGNPWEGFFLDLAEPVSLDVRQEMTLSFYQSDSGSHDILLKLESGTGPDVEVSVNTSGIGWAEDLVFDFANATISGTSTPISALGEYSRITIFIDPGVSVSGTYFMDDINGAGVNDLDVIYTDLVWADEFETDGAVNSDNWFHQTQLPAGGSWFNGEQQHYTNRIENSFVNNGFLNIVAIKESFTDQGETKQYTSARLNSKFAFTHGRVDVRAKLPFGDGTWPAIWTLGKNIDEDGAYWDNQGFGTTSWPACGEIDIMEHGLGAVNHVSSAVHSPSSFGNTVNFQSFVLNDVANDFHVYSVNWSPNQITFLIDDVGYYTYNPAIKDASTWPFDDDHYLLLNIAMGGVAGTIDPNFIQSSMEIDYVRVYQNNSLTIDDESVLTFSVYPNPTSNVIRIDSDSDIDYIQLYNIMGQLVLEKKQRTKHINIENLEKGVYILKIQSGDLSAVKRIVKN